MQKLYYMEPVNYDGNTFYPYFYNGEALCLPYNYKEYAKELIESFPNWKMKARTTAMHQYSMQLAAAEYAKHQKDSVDQYFGTYNKNPNTKTVEAKSYDEIYEEVVENMLPEFVSYPEVEPYIIEKAKESLLPTYRLDEVLQLTFYDDACKEDKEAYEASI